MVARVGLSSCLVLVTLDLSASFSIASSTPGTRSIKFSTSLSTLQTRQHPIRMMAEESEAARREKLAQLFGAEAGAKIAEKTGSAPRDLPVEQVPNVEEEIQMLVEGMQQLEFGGIRLIDVDMAPGPLELGVSPLLSDSTLLCCRLDMPLGMLLEESEDDDGSKGAMVVAELIDEGSAKAGGVMVGDLLRATTAMTMRMSYPTWQLMMGGVGQPKMQKILFGAQGEPFEKVMAAIGSNAREQQGNGQVVLVLERPK